MSYPNSITTASGYNIYVQKLNDNEHFQKILNYNLKRTRYWEKVYPHHRAWIHNVIKELKEDTYKRIAFGGFFNNIKTRKYELGCSVIVKKNPFTKSLEIKNLIVFNSNKDSNEKEVKYYYASQLLVHIIKFAEKRGFPKIVVELLNRNNDDKDLIKVFIDNDFTISGSHSERYNKSDEIVFLSYDVNKLYGFDPYDNPRASIWLIENFINATKVTPINSVLLLTDDNKQIEGTAYSFHKGKYFDNSTKGKFNTEYILLIIEEYFFEINKINNIKEIKCADFSFSKLYIFNFSDRDFSRLINNTEISSKFIIFNRFEIKELIGQQNLSLPQYSNIGGLVLISDPRRFHKERLQEIQKSDNTPLYIKLGEFGYYNEDKPIILAFFPEKEARAELKIWGIVDPQSPPFRVSILELQKNNEDKNSFDIDGNFFSENYYSDEDILYDYIKSINEDMSTEYVPIWSKNEFEKHNRYNPTSRVVCFPIKKLSYIDEVIYLQDIIENKNKIEDIENVFDFYLTRGEVSNLKKKLDTSIFGEHESSINNTRQSSTTKTLKILISLSDPLDEHRISHNIDRLKEIVSGEKRKITCETINNTDYSRLRKTLFDFEPNILHFIGHGDSNGLVLKNPNTHRKQVIENKHLKDIFYNQKNLIAVLLTSCYSSHQAKIISTYKIYVIGLEREITNETANNLSESFYKGLTYSDNNINDFKNIVKNICVTFLKTYDDSNDNLSVWYDGKKINLL